MLMVKLPKSQRPTTALGFGCAYLTGGLELRRNIQIVHAAYDGGFRHFDVAPLYGIGTAEDVLGAALKGRRAEVTIASKVGKPRPKLTLRKQLIRMAAVPIRRLGSNRIRKHERERVIMPEHMHHEFNVAQVRHSLHETLRRLQTDYIDMLLLHEASLVDISDDLLSYLDLKRKEGVIGLAGLATNYDRGMEILKAYPGFFDVFQHSWSPLEKYQPQQMPSIFRVTHRTLMYAYQPLRNWLTVDQAAAKRLSIATRHDLSDGTTLSSILLGAAIAENPQGIVLVGTRRKSMVQTNAQAMRDAALVSAGRAFVAALDLEANCPTHTHSIAL